MIWDSMTRIMRLLSQVAEVLNCIKAGSGILQRRLDHRCTEERRPSEEVRETDCKRVRAVEAITRIVPPETAPSGAALAWHMGLLVAAVSQCENRSCLSLLHCA